MRSLPTDPPIVKIGFGVGEAMSQMRTMRPAAAYIDSKVFDREMERIFRCAWVCVGRTEELPEPGSFVQREIAGERLLIVRGQDNTIRAFHNVCRHRGT